MIQTIVVEDNQHLLENVVFGLNAEGIHTRGAATEKQLIMLFAEKQPDVVVLDIRLSGNENGLKIAQRLRDDPKLGIVMLSCLDSVNDCVTGLDHADAYLNKPVDIRKLAAVVRSVHRHTLRLYEKQGQNGWLLRTSHLTLTSPDGKSTDLTYKESVILAALARARNKVVTTQLLVSELNGEWHSFDKNRIELTISHLRSKLMASMDRPFNPIKVARSVGYILSLDVSVTT